MTATLHPLTAEQVQARLAANTALLVDIREADEFARSHIHGAHSHPLSALDLAGLSIAPGSDVIFTCRTGMRTAGACNRLVGHVTGDAFVLDGGIDAWVKAGLPLDYDHSAPMEMNRQVQITAGLLILSGVALGFWVSPLWFGLAGFVGGGLTFAGLTGTCTMARLLMLAPWNRRAA